MPREQIDRIDAWAAEQPDKPTRPEAVRRLVVMGLGGPEDDVEDALANLEEFVRLIRAGELRVATHDIVMPPSDVTVELLPVVDKAIGTLRKANRRSRHGVGDEFVTRRGKAGE